MTPTLMNLRGLLVIALAMSVSPLVAINLDMVLHERHMYGRVLAELCSTVSNISASYCGSRGHKFKTKLSRITFMEIDHDIISTAILLLIQEGQLSVTDKNTCTITS